MSNISCDACNNLREYAPNFVQNGVTDDVCASLENNTGLNPGLTVLHDNCEDLHDVNDCLIGRMTDEVEAYDICDWKDFTKKFLGNLYETLKALICSMCGLWARVDTLCAAIANLYTVIGGSGAYTHLFTPTALFHQKIRATNPAWQPTDVRMALEAEYREGVICGGDKKLHVWRINTAYVGGNHPPQIFTFSVTNLAVGDVLGYIPKSVLVPTYGDESWWQYLVRGVTVRHSMFFIGSNTVAYGGLRGYTVIDGQEFNVDLKQYGTDVVCLEVTGFVGPDRTGGGAQYPEELRVSVD